MTHRFLYPVVSEHGWPMPTEDELKNMPPEQIAELQKQNCICCLISGKKVQAKVVYEDAQCVAVLEINPANPGHMLLFPREHYLIMPQVPEDVLRHLFQVSKHLSQAALRALQVERTNITVANGAAAGQRVPHFMVEIIPRMADCPHLRCRRGWPLTRSSRGCSGGGSMSCSGSLTLLRQR